MTIVIVDDDRMKRKERITFISVSKTGRLVQKVTATFVLQKHSMSALKVVTVALGDNQMLNVDHLARRFSNQYQGLHCFHQFMEDLTGSFSWLQVNSGQKIVTDLRPLM